MEGLFDNLEGRSDSLNFESLTSTLRFCLCALNPVSTKIYILYFKLEYKTIHHISTGKL